RRDAETRLDGAVRERDSLGAGPPDAGPASGRAATPLPEAGEGDRGNGAEAAKEGSDFLMRKSRRFSNVTYLALAAPRMSLVRQCLQDPTHPFFHRVIPLQAQDSRRALPQPLLLPGAAAPFHES